MTYNLNTTSHRLFDPQHSVFVAANAGSGKTSLLVKRVVSLLYHGIRPHKILCLTYTNSAAAEMSDRIAGVLSSWVMMDDNTLKEKISELTDKHIEAKNLAFARSLFATVIDAPAGLHIQTIHSFCQSLLARFPLEAGVDMHLSIMDGHSQQAVMRDAELALFNQAGANDEDLRHSLYRLVQHLGEYSLQELLSEIVTNKQKFRRLLGGNISVERLIAQIYHSLGLTTEKSEATIIAEYLPPDETLCRQLQQAREVLAGATASTNIACFKAIDDWLRHDTPDAKAVYAWHGFATNSNSELKNKYKLFNKNTLPAALEDAIVALQARVAACVSALLTLENAVLSSHMLRLAAALMRAYEQMKDAQGLTDFDDQILNTTALLTRQGMAAWVLYKLDGGIDHILVDEAQDTSGEQWTIVRALTEEFLSGQGSEKGARSLFIVGDEKQSIFRFQGADPKGFARERQFFSRRMDDAALPYQHVALTHSYRSAPEILRLVEAVFAASAAAAGLTSGDEVIAHQVRRDAAKGYAEFWPLVAADKSKNHSSHFILAEQIAEQIQSWLQEGYYLPPKERCVRAGDIMVLVRQRRGVMMKLARALKRRNIPVAGVDRVNLLDELVIQDLLAFADILLLPEDDLTLAGLLKSPLFNAGEEELFALAHKRERSLWQSLSSYAPLQEAYRLLVDFRSQVDFISPYALFSQLLEVRGFRTAFTGRMGMEIDDLLDEFLEQCLIYEKSHTPSMQGFLSWMRSSDSDIKRDMEQAGNAVRIMTVHGAKGLQAPIVFVADTTSVPTLKNRLYWHGYGPYTLPLLSARAEEDSAIITQAKQEYLAEEMDEYRRLLYVALTRAEDWLIVCGAEHNRGAHAESWYRLVEPAFKALGREEGERYIIGEMIVRESQPNSTIPEKIVAVAVPNIAPPEPLPPRPLAPSHITAMAPAITQSSAATHSNERGVAMHRIFQHVPQLPQHRWPEAAALIARNYAPHADESTQQAMVTEALRVMNHPDFAPLFSKQSLAEVPVSGVVNWQQKDIAVSGQIDRLWLGEQELWLVDFKSHSQPPAEQDIPRPYIQQLALYKALLAAIYPNHHICAGLLWTSIPRLDIIDAKLLDEVAATAYI